MDKTITFDDLDKFIEYWIRELTEIQHLFANQTQQLNKQIFLNQANDELLQTVKTSMGFIHYLSHQIDLDFVTTFCNLKHLERIVTEIENAVKDNVLSPIDLNRNDLIRKDMYGIYQPLQLEINYYQNRLEDIMNRQTLNTYLNPMQQVSIITNSCHQNLMKMDTQMQCMQTKIDEIDLICQRMLQFYEE